MNMTQPAAASSPPAKPRRARARASLFAQGEPMLWLTGSGLVLAVTMIIGLLVLIFIQGIGTLWPVPVLRFALHDGRTIMGEVARSESYRPTSGDLASLPAEIQERLRRERGEPGTWSATRHLVRTGNFELTGEHFMWSPTGRFANRRSPAGRWWSNANPGDGSTVNRRRF